MMMPVRRLCSRISGLFIEPTSNADNATKDWRYNDKLGKKQTNMAFEVINYFLATLCLVAFLANGLHSARANDSRFLTMPKTVPGKILLWTWLIALVASAFGHLFRLVPPLTLKIVAFGGITAQLTMEVISKITRVRTGDTTVDPNV